MLDTSVVASLHKAPPSHPAAAARKPPASLLSPVVLPLSKKDQAHLPANRPAQLYIL